MSEKSISNKKLQRLNAVNMSWGACELGELKKVFQSKNVGKVVTLEFGLDLLKFSVGNNY